MWWLKWESSCTFNHTTYLMAIYKTCLNNFTKNVQIWIKEKITNLLLTFLFIRSNASSQKSLKSKGTQNKKLKLKVQKYIKSNTV